MSRILFLLAVVVLANFPNAVFGGGLKIVDRPTVRLLSVGVSTFADPQLARLVGPARDARLLESVFSSMGGRLNNASATVLTDEMATKDSIIRAYTSILSQAKSDELVVFFLSGHTLQDPLTSRSYFAPYDYRTPSDGSRPDTASGINLEHDIVRITPADQNVLIIMDGCNIGDGSLGQLFDQHPNLALLASSKSDEVAVDTGPFVPAIAGVLKLDNSDLDGDGRLSVEELYVQLYPKMVGASVGFYSRQHPSLAGLHSHRLMLATAAKSNDNLTTSAATRAVVSIQVPSDFDGIAINGQPLEKTDYRMDDGKLTFLGSNADAIRSGINLLEIGRQKFYLWKVGRTLNAFREPYKHSSAIIVAIDDYNRERDTQLRGPTGFPQLTGMVDRAKQLKSELVALGFSETGIIELYNEDATAQKLEDKLKSFWVGGTNAETDRLVVYFGGHGEDFQKNNLLVTYDYEKSRRLLTSFQAKDLIERHSRNIQASHVLLALDVCYAGLVFLGPDERSSNQELEDAERLALIERDVTGRARNIIVAGTGDQRALWENGGIFTAALIEGLRGKADPSNSGVIQFDQLGIFVKNKVTTSARRSGITQVPKFVSMDEFGEGRVMFIRPAQK